MEGEEGDSRGNGKKKDRRNTLATEGTKRINVKNMLLYTCNKHNRYIFKDMYVSNRYTNEIFIYILFIYMIKK